MGKCGARDGLVGSPASLGLAHVDEDAPGHVLHDSHVIIDIHEAHTAERLLLVPGQELPHSVYRDPLILHQTTPNRDERNTRRLLDLGALQLHRQLVTLQLQVLGLCHHAASKGRQKLEPANDGNDSQGEEGRVEVRLKGLGAEIDPLRDLPDGGHPPGAHLQQMELEEQIALLFAVQGGLDGQEEWTAAEQLNRRVHQLPRASHLLFTDVARVLVDQLCDEPIHLGLLVLHGIGYQFIEPLATVSEGCNAEDLALNLTLGCHIRVGSCRPRFSCSSHGGHGIELVHVQPLTHKQWVLVVGHGASRRGLGCCTAA
mmetsp:Transcript_11557/g.20883  ORF Transcript_11557/g.20883 Transcript_11557/m.20883 type:complete len:315 (+) Transcript_11557:1196-2140(+)